MEKKLIVSPSPHIHGAMTTRRLMKDVVIALIPALIVATIVYGTSALIVTGVSVAACVAFEYLIQRFMLKGPVTIGDYSAVVTGLLLGFNLPNSLPIWIVLIGALVAVGVGKMSFGGLGRNPFNPALVGRVFLLISFPAQMTSYVTPSGVDSLSGASIPVEISAEMSVDAVSGPTLLGYVKEALAGGRSDGPSEFLRRHAAGLPQRVAGRNSGFGIAARRHLLALPPGHHLAYPGSRARIDDRFLRHSMGCRSSALHESALPSADGRRFARRPVHGHRLRNLADDVAGHADLRSGDRDHHDSDPRMGRLSGRHVFRYSDYERRRAADQQVCQAEALRSRCGPVTFKEYEYGEFVEKYGSYAAGHHLRFGGGRGNDLRDHPRAHRRSQEREDRQCGRAGRAAVRQQSGRDENDRLAGRQDRYGLYGPVGTGHGRICDRDIFQQRIRR